MPKCKRVVIGTVRIDRSTGEVVEEDEPLAPGSDPQARQDISELERIATHIKNRSALYSDPSYLQIKSPLAGEDLWIGQVIFDHHDGEVCEAQFDAPTIAELLPILWAYVKENYK